MSAQWIPPTCNSKKKCQFSSIVFREIHIRKKYIKLFSSNIKYAHRNQSFWLTRQYYIGRVLDEGRGKKVFSDHLYLDRVGFAQSVWWCHIMRDCCWCDHIVLEALSPLQNTSKAIAECDLLRFPSNITTCPIATLPGTNLKLHPLETRVRQKLSEILLLTQNTAHSFSSWWHVAPIRFIVCALYRGSKGMGATIALKHKRICIIFPSNVRKKEQTREMWSFVEY